MGLIKKLFGRDDAGRPVNQASSQFHESEASTDQGSRNAPRRELVHVVLRDTMRKHGIPSDWIECRILSVVSRSSTTGMHVHLVVRNGDGPLLTYVHAFQDSFRAELSRFDPNALDWLLSLSWQFDGNGVSAAPMPNPATWTAAGAAAMAVDQAEASRILAQSDEDDDEVARDLQALYAIRDAALSGHAPLPTSGTPGHADFQPTQPGMDDDPSRK